GVTLGDLEKGIEIQVKKASDGQVVTVPLKPRQAAGKLATIGIGMPWSLKLSGDEPAIDDSPAAKAKLIAPADGKIKADDAKLMDGDEIVRVGDVAVKTYPELEAILAQQPEKPLQVTVRREVKQEGAAASDKKPETQELTF